MSFEYEVGQRILNINPDCEKENAGEYGEIVAVMCGFVHVEYDNGNTGKSNKPEKYYKIVGHNVATATPKNNVNSIVKFAKNLVLSADEKLLRKHNLKNDCGDYSCEAKEVILAKLFADNESYLIDIAKQKETEDKENK